MCALGGLEGGGEIGLGGVAVVVVAHCNCGHTGGGFRWRVFGFIREDLFLLGLILFYVILVSDGTVCM